MIDFQREKICTFFSNFVPKVIFIENSICAVFISKLINYTTEKEKRLKMEKTRFSRHKKKKKKTAGDGEKPAVQTN